MSRPRAWELDQHGFRALLYQVADRAALHWGELASRRAFTRPPDEVRAAVRGEALPEAGRPLEETFDLMERTVLRYPLGQGHPRWWGFIASSAHPVGTAAEVLSTTLNNACFTGAQIAIDYEHLVLRWLTEICRYPGDAAGILVSGGSMANLVCLAAAREAMSRRGVGPRGGPVGVYVGAGAHYSVAKCLKLLGFTPDELRAAPSGPAGSIDLDGLRKQMNADRRRGIRPLAVIGTAGTAGTGVVDDLDRLADLAAEAGCWYHVDGAYGAPAAGLPELAERFRGIERADSLVVDPHKWLYVPYEAGAALVRRREDLLAAFSSEAPYTEMDADTYFGDGMGFQDLGPQQSREFRALKIWATVRSLGMSGLRELWRNDIAVAGEVCRLADEHPRLEVLSRGDLSVFVIRYTPARGDADAFNRRLLDKIHRDGSLFLGPMTVEGRFGLRGCVVNFRATEHDARICVETVAELGERLESSRLELAT